jgi:3-methylcrotonyl-CoA carboxylase beta subunit
VPNGLPEDLAASWSEIVESVRRDEERIREGGGAKARQRQHQKHRLTARERIDGLVDPGTFFLELGLFAAYGMYEEWGGVPSAAVVTGIGRVQGRLFMIIANDATVKAGSFFPMTVKKVLRAQRIAMDNRLPLIYLVDSSGVFLPLQDEIFPDEDDFGRIFRNNARLSAEGVPQIAAIMGPCVAGGAYLPVMCDRIVMTEGSGLYIAGPSLVKAAIGQQIGSEQLGGAQLHAALSGTVDFREASDEDCLQRLRELASLTASPPRPVFDRGEERLPARESQDVYGLMPLDGSQEYDMREILRCFTDGGELTEYKAEYGKTVLCAYARICGWAVGLVANQKQHVKEPGKPYEVGGVIYTESADKAARFIMDCNQNRLPLLFFHDVNGFMVGRAAEISGIIKSGAKLVNAVSNSVVPKITVIVGGSYGAGHYALCGKAYDPRFIFAWPTCRYAVMGGDQAARTLLDLRVRQLEKQGRQLSDEDRDRLLEEIKLKYEQELDPRHAAARLWVDAILEPHQTRQVLGLALQVAALNTDVPQFKTGVLQV